VQHTRSIPVPCSKVNIDELKTTTQEEFDELYNQADDTSELHLAGIRVSCHNVAFGSSPRFPIVCSETAGQGQAIAG